LKNGNDAISEKGGIQKGKGREERYPKREVRAGGAGSGIGNRDGVLS